MIRNSLSKRPSISVLSATLVCFLLSCTLSTNPLQPEDDSLQPLTDRSLVTGIWATYYQRNQDMETRHDDNTRKYIEITADSLFVYQPESGGCYSLLRTDFTHESRFEFNRWVIQENDEFYVIMWGETFVSESYDTLRNSYQDSFLGDTTYIYYEKMPDDFLIAVCD
ncbi:MAG: hypothetical protein ACLFSB_05370 [Chitinispirillaceae bacterium]